MPQPAISFRASNAARFYASHSAGPVVTLPASATVEGHRFYYPHSLLDSSSATEKQVTYVAPSATGQGVHTRWCDIEDLKAEEEAPSLGEDLVASPRSLSRVRREVSLPSSEPWNSVASMRSLLGSVNSLAASDSGLWVPPRQNASPVYGPEEDDDDDATEDQSSRSLYPDGSATLVEIPHPAAAPDKWGGPSQKATSSEFAPRTRGMPVSEASTEFCDAWAPSRQNASPVYGPDDDDDDDGATEPQPSGSLNPDSSATSVETSAPAALAPLWEGPSQRDESGRWKPRTLTMSPSEAKKRLWEEPLKAIGYRSMAEEPKGPRWAPAVPCTGYQMRLHYEEGDRTKKLLTCNFDPYDRDVDPKWRTLALDRIEEGRRLIIVD